MGVFSWLDSLQVAHRTANWTAIRAAFKSANESDRTTYFATISTSFGTAKQSSFRPAIRTTDDSTFWTAYKPTNNSDRATYRTA